MSLIVLKFLLSLKHLMLQINLQHLRFLNLRLNLWLLRNQILPERLIVLIDLRKHLRNLMSLNDQKCPRMRLIHLVR